MDASSPSMSSYGVFIVPGLVGVVGAYLLWLNSAMLRQPEAALQRSPTRYTEESVRAAAVDYAKNPPDIQAYLPPPTGNRYIVLGGAGFLGGWIVLQLLQRGEDPRSIRVLDIQPVTRQDLLEAQAKGVEFLRVDVSDEEAVLSAFSRAWPHHDEARLTVIHTASNIRFFERHERQLPASSRVNVRGTEHVIKAAKLAGASVLIYTSSGSIAIKPSRFWIWPWETSPQPFVHLIGDDSSIPLAPSDAWSNYAATKIMAERLVRAADNTLNASGKPMRTSCLRPGNGVFGPGGDILCGAFLVRRVNPTWIWTIIQNFCYVENVALAHLQLERSLLEDPSAAGGDAFCISDPNPPISYGDLYLAENILTDGETKFPKIPPIVAMLLAHAIEFYVHARLGSSFLSRVLPPVTGDIVNLQPSLFSLTSAHLIFDDSRAQRVFGYKPVFTTLQGICKLVDEFKRSGGRAEARQMQPGGGGVGFGLAAAQRGVAKAATRAGILDAPTTPELEVTMSSMVQQRWG